jgi:hypothetical protein
VATPLNPPNGVGGAFSKVRIPPLAKRFLRVVQMGEKKITGLGDVLRRDSKLYFLQAKGISSMTTDASTTKDHRPVAILAPYSEAVSAERSTYGKLCPITESMQRKG